MESQFYRFLSGRPLVGRQVKVGTEKATGQVAVWQTDERRE